MALNDTFIKNSTKHSGRPAGDKHSDGGGLHLHVTASGKYWRMAYRFAEKQKTLALGAYPAVSLLQARKRPTAETPIPFSAATLWRKVRSGEFPAPAKLSEGVTAWRVGDVRAWLNAKQAGSVA